MSERDLAGLIRYCQEMDLSDPQENDDEIEDWEIALAEELLKEDSHGEYITLEELARRVYTGDDPQCP
jgi:hypothetical protein